MSQRMGFGIGAGAMTLLAAVLAVSPVVRGDGAGEEKATSKTEEKAGRKSDRKVDHRVRIVAGGGSYLGVRLEDVDKEDVARLKLPEEKGALVTSVVEDSPASEAGIEADDVIVRYHGEGVLGASQLARLVRETPRGREVPIEVVRGGAVQKLSVTLAEDDRSAFKFEGELPDWHFDIPELAAPVAPVPPVPPMPPAAPRAFDRWGKRALLDEWGWFGRGPRKLGIEYQEISGQLAKYFKLAKDSGVLVTSVADDGPAGKAGLKAGDVILELDGREVQDTDDLQRAIAKADPGKEVVVSVQREGRQIELKVTLAGERRREREGTEL
jgi:serine protease Do